MEQPIVDFHAHILPNADHGSDSLETTFYQLKQADQAGVNIVVATTHFYPNLYSDVNSFLHMRGSAVQMLSQAYHGPIKILPAAEVMLCEGLHHLPRIDKLCICGTRTILVEMPLTRWSPSLIDSLGALERICGLKVVIAHIDRYPQVQREQLVALGFQAQINAESLCSFSKTRLLHMAEKPFVVAIGSDIHGKSDEYKKFSKAVHLLGAAVNPLMDRSVALLGDYSAPGTMEEKIKSWEGVQ